ncbi:FAS1 domain-containing protein [Podospora appendiculata]|uniref:FAS1 domain-containing protein n=1 Tax=Podospora appendiculata TaxID=314037 RepID=A0AAE0X5I8_9PEZI|nr:FAS1 domain-containing protein [Podospora appendiculata]
MKLAKYLLAMPIAIVISAQTFSDVLSDPNAALELLNSYLAGEEALFALLSTAKDITVLAPSNEALYRLENDEAMIARFADPGMMGAFLKYHVFSGVWYSSNFTAAKAPLFVPTMLNDTAFTNVTGGQRVKAHAKDGEVVLYSGMLTQTPIKSANYNFSGGTIHIIDRVLTVPPNITDTLVTANLTAAAGALKVAQMAQGIGQGSPVTVLAPDNDAFNAIGKVIGAMSTADLAAVMGYHVIPGQALYSGMIKNGTAATAAQDDSAVLRFRVEDDGAIFVNSARIIQSDILFDNGVIHMLDGVLNPANTSAAPNPTASTQAPAFSGEGTTDGVPFTSGIGTPTSAAPTATVTDLGTLPVAGAPVPLRTGAVRAALLLGGIVMLVNA